LLGGFGRGTVQSVSWLVAWWDRLVVRCFVSWLLCGFGWGTVQCVSWLVVWWDRLVVCFGELAALWVWSGDSSVCELVRQSVA
jgi:hypothetical protein